VKVTSSAVSLNVRDERASADFLVRHFGFVVEMASDGFVSLTRPDVGLNVIYLRTGLATFKPDRLRGHDADGLLLVLVVDDVDAEYARLLADRVEFTTHLETEPWGERYFQVSDPNGIVIQLVTWVGTPPAGESPSD
jgi:catechol 2,3-dioxygenase-like lactoylglutathione lyase family enzyme